MTQVLFILICLFSYFISVAQPNYVVTTKGDTIQGKVKYFNSVSGQKVHVTTSEGKKNVYSITQTIAFKLDNDIYYPVRITNGYIYMKMIKQGYLSLLAFQLPNQLLWDGRYLLKKDGKGIEVPNIGFKKILVQFLSECPELTKRIALGEYSKSEVREIVDQYNDCIVSNTISNGEVQNPHQLDKLVSWDTLGTDVSNLNAFDQKADALEMISEIKSKIKRGEKIPKFLSEGLKDALKDQPTVKASLDKALLSIND